MRTFDRQPRIVEELTQEVFVEAYFSLRKYRGDGEFAAWLNRIATRVGYRYWKRQQRSREVIQASDWWRAVPESLVEKVDPSRAAELVRVLLDQLPPRDRLVLLLLYVEGHTIAEAARLAGWSQIMIRVQAFRRGPGSACCWPRRACAASRRPPTSRQSWPTFARGRIEKRRKKVRRTVNEIELLNRLGAQARDEADPTIDISRQVRRRLRACRVRTVDRPLAWASLTACSLAVLAVTGAILWPSAGDSVAALSELVTSGGEPEVVWRLLEP